MKFSTRYNNLDYRPFSVLGFLLACVILFSISTLTFEYCTGNADGVWNNINIVEATYKVAAILVLVTLLFYCLLQGPNLLRNLLVSTLIFGVLLLLLEGACFLIFAAVSTPPSPAKATSEPLLRPDWTDSFVEDNILGIRAKKDWSLKWAPLKDGVLYDSIMVSTNQYSLRHTTSTVAPDIYEKHALFFGGSFTYGDGVSDHETLPSQFQKQMPIYQTCNFGFLAYSPLHMLARLQHEDLTLLPSHKKGFAAYIYINDHIDRTIPATRWITMTKGKFPDLDEESVTTNGVFSENSRLYSNFIQWFRTTYIHHIFRVDFPKKHTSEHFQLMVDVIRQSKQEYQKQFGRNDFYVIIFPGNPIKPEMKQMLQNAGLVVLDYSKLFDLDKYLLPFDNTHPNARAYQLVAAQLAKDITARTKQPIPDRSIKASIAGAK